MTIYEQLKETEGKREYVREVLKAGGLTAWEAKEYSNLEIQYTETIADLKEKIKHYEANYA